MTNKFNICLVLVLLVGSSLAQISDHLINENTKDFGEVTSVYKKDWYSGYLDVSGNKIHYWYFPAAGTQPNAPLLVQVNSGPGCSTIAREATYGSAPFVFVPGTSGFELNPYSWNENANLLYIDTPGTGFTKGNDEKYSDSYMTEIIYSTIKNFVTNYNLSGKDLYLSGIGYAGLIVPRLALLIYNTNSSQQTKDLDMEFKGFLTGNGVTVNAQIPAKIKDFPHHTFFYLKDQGILSWDIIDDFTKDCGYDPDDLTEKDQKCKDRVASINDILFGLNRQDINADCFENDLGNCYDSQHEESFFNKESVRKALNVLDDFGKESDNKFNVCNVLKDYAVSSSILYAYEELVKVPELKIWVFSGASDSEVPFSSTIHWIESLRADQGLSDLIGYQSWFYGDILEISEEPRVQNGGSYWKMDGLSFVRFKGCGQDTLRCNPIGAQLMFKNFVFGEPMEVDPFAENLVKVNKKAL